MKDCMCHELVLLPVLQYRTGTALQEIYSEKHYAKLCQLKMNIVTLYPYSTFQTRLKAQTPNTPSDMEYSNNNMLPS